MELCTKLHNNKTFIGASASNKNNGIGIKKRGSFVDIRKGGSCLGSAESTHAWYQFLLFLLHFMVAWMTLGVDRHMGRGVHSFV